MDRNKRLEDIHRFWGDSDHNLRMGEARAKWSIVEEAREHTRYMQEEIDRLTKESNDHYQFGEEHMRRADKLSLENTALSNENRILKEQIDSVEFYWDIMRSATADNERLRQEIEKLKEERARTDLRAGEET